VTRFQRALKRGTEPELLPRELPTVDESVLARQWRETGVPERYLACGPGDDLNSTGTGGQPIDWPGRFAVGLSNAATEAVEVAGGAVPGGKRKPWELAMSWFLSSYPLLDAPLSPTTGVDLDDFYRRALLTGYTYHRRDCRGLLPAGLVAEIRVLEQPPLPWDAKLARWFDEFVPSPVRVRSFARPSRRQASTPDIPRPGWRWPDEAVSRCTFGVVLDTSGSMNHELLGKALGAIASYATARDVPAARVVFCDAHAYDAGYLPVEQIAGRVRVRGRGGTVLQPGVDLLERAVDFPPTAPVLVITDGYCDVLRIRREHAFLVPAEGRLPFTPRGPVFTVR
jgi:hypothetical protein